MQQNLNNLLGLLVTSIKFRSTPITVNNKLIVGYNHEVSNPQIVVDERSARFTLANDAYRILAGLRALDLTQEQKEVIIGLKIELMSNFNKLGLMGKLCQGNKFDFSLLPGDLELHKKFQSMWGK
nr:MAG TPA: hypothetical protein [Caudoviricetes sp.]